MLSTAADCGLPVLRTWCRRRTWRFGQHLVTSVELAPKLARVNWKADSSRSSFSPAAWTGLRLARRDCPRAQSGAEQGHWSAHAARHTEESHLPSFVAFCALCVQVHKQNLRWQSALRPGCPQQMLTPHSPRQFTGWSCLMVRALSQLPRRRH